MRVVPLVRKLGHYQEGKGDAVQFTPRKESGWNRKLERHVETSFYLNEKLIRNVQLGEIPNFQ